MKILALEFSSPQRSVAIVQGTKGGGSSSISEVVETGGIATRPLAMIEAALTEAKLEREQLECLGIGLGPGSYTGIRTAIALAQGWQLARGVKLLGLSSADSIAAAAQAEGLTGRVAVVIDAQRGEFYLSLYELTATDWRGLEPIQLVSSTQVLERHKAGAQLIGPEITQWFPQGRLALPQAGMLGRLALGQSNYVAGENLEPIYLRQTAFVKAPPIVPLPGIGHKY